MGPRGFPPPVPAPPPPATTEGCRQNSEGRIRWAWPPGRTRKRPKAAGRAGRNPKGQAHRPERAGLDRRGKTTPCRVFLRRRTVSRTRASQPALGLGASACEQKNTCGLGRAAIIRRKMGLCAHARGDSSFRSGPAAAGRKDSASTGWRVGAVGGGCRRGRGRNSRKNRNSRPPMRIAPGRGTRTGPSTLRIEEGKDCRAQPGIKIEKLSWCGCGHVPPKPLTRV